MMTMSPRKRKEMLHRFYLVIFNSSAACHKQHCISKRQPTFVQFFLDFSRTTRQQQQQQQQQHERKDREKRTHKTEQNELLPRRGREATATRRRKRRENYNLRATTFPSRTGPTPIVINGTSRPSRRSETSVHATSDWCSRERSGTNLPRSRKSRADANELL